MLRLRLIVPIIVMGIASSARAEDAPWTLQRVIAAARSRAPAATIARAQVEEVRAELVGARRLATRNPSIQIGVGPRWADGVSTDVQSQLSLPLDPGGRRGKRIAVAEAAIRQQELGAKLAARRAVAIAVAAYYAVLQADRRLALASERVRLATAAEDTATRRHRAGDVAEFEVNLARGEVTRAQGAVASVRSEATRARGQLAAALGVPMTELTTIAGDLADRSLVETSAKAAALRPELEVLAQEAALAKAQAALARAERWPSLDFRLNYEHERDGDIVLGGFAVSLPILDRGQGAAAKANARAKRAAVELEARSAVATAQLQAAHAAYSSAVAAVRVFEDSAIPLALENQTAADASYRAGKIDFATLIVIRREALETRREHLDRLLDAALAGVELWVAQGSYLQPGEHE